ncbi:MAG: aryl-sulfate sulfotransferase [Bacteroidetes bacterium]|nr:aryl-sulfate sulfotransferase [Bacteroidota bacterium]
MKILQLFIAMLLLAAVQVTAQSLSYISPVPDSRYNSRETNIILRSIEPVDEDALSSASVRVTGSVSGSHPGTLTLSDDRHTILFHAKRPFEPSEVVTVRLNGRYVGTKEFTFTVTPQSEPLSRSLMVTEEGDVINRPERSFRSDLRMSSAADSLPADFPKFTVTKVKDPSPGYFFLTTSDDVAGVGHFFYMIDNAGKVINYQRRPGHVYDFKVQPNGLLSYADPFSDWGYAGGSRCVHRILDSTFAAVDSFRAGNGYDADTHEFLMLSNGHVVLHAYDIQYMDLSKIIPGGNANAIVVGSIMQELDLQKNVVFQWRSWDHVDVAETYMNKTAAAFDYIHVNAYDMDTDGNFLLCFRNTCEVVKVNRTTGEFMWRLGGKSNQFTFFGETESNKPAYFTFPHSMKRLPNGNIILFDNGNLHVPMVSRAVEYTIDQVNKTATQVWQYHHSPEVYAPTRGSVQRLPNGNTVIGWGSASFVGVGKTMITELSPQDSILFEMESLDKMPSYRALKFVWNSHVRPAAEVQIAEILPGNDYSFNKGDTNRTGVSIRLTDAIFGYNAVTVKRFAYSPVKMEFPELAPMTYAGRFVIEQVGISSFTADITIDSTVIQPSPYLQQMVVHGREFEGSGMFLPLTTVYDPAKRSLTVTSTKFGEFIIGIPMQLSTPFQPKRVSPLMDALVNQTRPVLIRWSAEGHITGSHLQIAKDSMFTTMVFNDSLLMASYKLWSGYEANTRYYWRAKAVNEIGKSAWSAIGTFMTSNVYLMVQYPTAALKLQTNSTYVLKYENNFEERVNIRLYKNNNLALKIKDSTENTGRFVWKVPAAGVTTDSTYAIKVTSVLDSNIAASSPVFSIEKVAGVEHEAVTVDRFELMQNFPNPFNPSTTIRFSVPAAQHVTVKVFDLLGKEMAVLVNEQLSQGRYSFTYHGDHTPSGIYFCRMEAGSFVSVKKIVLIK